MKIIDSYNPKTPDFKNWKSALKTIDENYKLLDQLDKQAKKLGTMIGRIIREPYADGHAVYIVTAENKRTCTIEVCRGLGDDWVLPYFGEKTTVKKSYIEEHIRRKEALAKIFS